MEKNLLVFVKMVLDNIFALMMSDMWHRNIVLSSFQVGELFNGVLIGYEKKGNDSYILNYLSIAEEETISR